MPHSGRRQWNCRDDVRVGQASPHPEQLPTLPLGLTDRTLAAATPVDVDTSVPVAALSTLAAIRAQGARVSAAALLRMCLCIPMLLLLPPGRATSAQGVAGGGGDANNRLGTCAGECSDVFSSDLAVSWQYSSWLRTPNGQLYSSHNHTPPLPHPSH